MRDRPERHPHEPPLMSLASLRQLIDDLPTTWQLGIDDTATLVIFDDQDRPRGHISVADGRIVHINPVEDENLS